MNCQKANYYPKDYLDDVLDQVTRDAIRQHLEECRKCQDRIKLEKEFRNNLKDLPAAIPNPGFKMRAFKRVYALQHRNRLIYSTMIRMAAGILLVFSLGFMFKGLWNTGRPESPQAYLSLNKQSEIKLVFSSKQSLENVSFMLEPPKGVARVLQATAKLLGRPVKNRERMFSNFP